MHTVIIPQPQSRFLKGLPDGTFSHGLSCPEQKLVELCNRAMAALNIMTFGLTEFLTSTWERVLAFVWGLSPPDQQHFLLRQPAQDDSGNRAARLRWEAPVEGNLLSVLPMLHNADRTWRSAEHGVLTLPALLSQSTQVRTDTDGLARQ